MPSRATALSCEGWQQERALRLLMNNLDPDFAQKPDELIIYGSGLKPAWIVIARGCLAR